MVSGKKTVRFLSNSGEREKLNKNGLRKEADLKQHTIHPKFVVH